MCCYSYGVGSGGLKPRLLCLLDDDQLAFFELIGNAVLDAMKYTQLATFWPFMFVTGHSTFDPSECRVSTR